MEAYPHYLDFLAFLMEHGIDKMGSQTTFLDDTAIKPSSS